MRSPREVRAALAHRILIPVYPLTPEQAAKIAAWDAKQAAKAEKEGKPT